jgi:5'-3' exonuclease
MGIPGFFNSMSKNYNIAIPSINKLKLVDIYLDFNSLIYTSKYIIFAILINYIKFKLDLKYDTTIDFSKISNTLLIDKLCKNYFLNQTNFQSEYKLDLEEIGEMKDQMIFDCILELVKNIYFQVEKIRIMVIHLDGVPYIGKMIEQRKRALLSGLINRGRELLFINTKVDSKTLFLSIIDPYINLDKTVIKPGTNFMIKLSNWLNTTFKNIIISDIKKSNKDFNPETDWILTTFDIPGEAEHKIMDNIIQNKLNNNDILVYSPDADMIVLLLPLTLKYNIFLVRDSVDKSVYSLNKLNQDIEIHFYDLIKTNMKFKDFKINLNRLILDISFIYNIFGNDFLPKLDNINIYDKSTITRVFTQYIKYLNSCLEKKIELDKIYLIDSNSELNWFNYCQFLLLLNKEFTHPKSEKIRENFEVKKLKHDDFNDQLYSLYNFGRGFYTKSQDKFIWKNDFYSNSQFFETDNIDEIVQDYLIGIIMIDILYSKIYVQDLTIEEKQIVQLWFYPHHKAPLIIDIYNYLNKFINKSHFDLSKFKNIIRLHLIDFLKKFPKIITPDPVFQLYYVVPDYDEFVKLINPDIKKYPILEEHKIYKEFISQLVWNKEKQELNITDLVDCNMQRFIDKCVPLLKSKLNNKYINLSFDIRDFIK